THPSSYFPTRRSSDLVAVILLLDAGPVAAQQGDRWQLTLNDGTIRWELHLIRFRGDTLAVQQGDSTLRFPVMQVDELRLVRKARSEEHTSELQSPYDL